MSEQILNPVEAISAEIESSISTQTVGMLRLKKANATIVEAARRPNPRDLYHGLWYEGEVCCLFASWVSDTLMYGTGECLHIEPDGLLPVYEQETELVVEAGVIVSSRTYTNRIRNTPGTVHFEDIRYQMPKEFRYDKFPEVKGRVTIRFNASEFNDEGKITDWDITILRCPENLPENRKKEIIEEVTRVLCLYDFQTFMRDGTWYWRTTRNAQPNWPLIFK